MNKPFVPEIPEKTVKVEITAREVHLLKCVRECKFGSIIIHKANGRLVRVETNKSVLLSEEEGEKAVEGLL